MNPESKVTAGHLKRAAYLYIRQSTLRQVFENTESTQRQYALQRRAVTLGWPEDRIVVIDHDQGQSGASTVEREGFQRLVADVGLGKAGIVMGLEVSRLARNCADWHRLLEICALTQTLILDEDGLYDPAHYNDRLLLGLKGTMSEAELHVLKARLIGGLISKAQRGELKLPLPIGLIYDEEDRVILDPDQQIQQSIRLFFSTFQRTGSAWGTIRAYRQEGLKFPRRGQAGVGEVLWQELTEGTALDTLHNPRYAGAFCFGRTRTWKDVEGKIHHRQLPRSQWRFVKTQAHPGYISWEEFVANEQRLLENHQAHGAGESKAGVAREGPALLQGLVICGKCGRLMSVRYHRRKSGMVADYLCQRQRVDKSEPMCQQIQGADLDAAVGRVLVASVSPLALEVVLNVQGEIQSRLQEAERLRQQQVQRAQYEADQARVRFMRVDPNNRLVADTLETQWNEKLRLLAEAKEECEKRRQLDAIQLTEEQKAKIRALASDFPRLWQDPKTTDRDRKQMARLLLEDVTLHRDRQIVAQLRFKGGVTQELCVPLPKRAWDLRKTGAEVIREIDRLLDQQTESEIAQEFNRRGWETSGAKKFNPWRIRRLEQTHHLKSRYERLREQGLLTIEEMARLLDCPTKLVYHWRYRGLIEGVLVNDLGERLYKRPSENIINDIKNRQRRRLWDPACLKEQPQGAV
jgi:DNA invertase Pin-like site-specific DNA recombinase